MKVLVIGANGFLGAKILSYSKVLAPDDRFVGADIVTDLIPSEFSPIRIDIGDKRSVTDVIGEVKPDTVILTAAMTAVDKCETDRDTAYRINALGPKYTAEACTRYGARLIYVSTDFVFNGEKGNYTEEDEPNPIGYYGYTKLEGEKFVRTSGVRYMICRTSVLFGWPLRGQRDNFFSWAYKKLAAGEKLKIVYTQRNNPTLGDDLAVALIKLRKFGESDMLHTCGSEAVSRYEMIVTLAEVFGFPIENVIKIDKFPQLAPRPPDASMSNAKARKKYGLLFRGVRDAMLYLKDTVPDYIKESIS